MDESTRRDLRRFVLSHEEFAFLFGLFGVRPVLGVEDSPLIGLPADQAESALRAASHGLLARGLVRTNAEGDVVVENKLLELLGTCAHPVRLVTVYHWAPTANLPAPLFIYRRDNSYTLQLRPDPALLELIAAPSPEMVIDAILRFCGGDDGIEAQPVEMHITQGDFLALRSFVEQGDIAAAESLATAQGDAAAQVGLLLKTLQEFPHVSAFTAFHYDAGKTVQRDAFTLLQSQQEMWLLNTDDRSARLAIKSVSSSQARALLSDVL